jgi:hypothetical protein
MSRRYREGDWFAVPLDQGGYGVGCIARANPDGILLGYFFGPARTAVPNLSELSSPSIADAVLVCRFGHLGLRQGTWPLIGAIASWDRRQLPIPEFGRMEELSGRAFAVQYRDDDIGKVENERQISINELAPLPSDGLFGAVAVEKMLSNLLRSEVGGSIRWPMT